MLCHIVFAFIVEIFFSQPYLTIRPLICIVIAYIAGEFSPSARSMAVTTRGAAVQWGNWTLIPKLSAKNSTFLVSSFTLAFKSAKVSPLWDPVYQRVASFMIIWKTRNWSLGMRKIFTNTLSLRNLIFNIQKKNENERWGLYTKCRTSFEELKKYP